MKKNNVNSETSVNQNENLGINLNDELVMKQNENLGVNLNEKMVMNQNEKLSMGNVKDLEKQEVSEKSTKSLGNNPPYYDDYFNIGDFTFRTYSGEINTLKWLSDNMVNRSVKGDEFLIHTESNKHIFEHYGVISKQRVSDFSDFFELSTEEVVKIEDNKKITQATYIDLKSIKLLKIDPKKTYKLELKDGVVLDFNKNDKVAQFNIERIATAIYEKRYLSNIAHNKENFKIRKNRLEQTKNDNALECKKKYPELSHLFDQYISKDIKRESKKRSKKESKESPNLFNGYTENNNVEINKNNIEEEKNIINTSIEDTNRDYHEIMVEGNDDKKSNNDIPINDTFDEFDNIIKLIKLNNKMLDDFINESNRNHIILKNYQEQMNGLILKIINNMKGILNKKE